MSLANLTLLVLQPTSFCNLNCRYCYVPDRRDKFRMSLKVLESTIKKLFEYKSKGNIDLLYHAGEPLAIGIEFYKKSIELVNKYKPQNVTICYTLQTNATLINDTWAKFLLENDFKVGVSLDGPKFLHDYNRKNWVGKGSYDKTLRGIEILRNVGIDPPILTVVTSKHLEYPEELGGAPQSLDQYKSILKSNLN